MNIASYDPCSADRTCARHDGKFARLSFSLVGRKVIGKKAADGAEEVDWNTIFNCPVGRRLWYHVKE
jgi:hypothetical protein